MSDGETDQRRSNGKEEAYGPENDMSPAEPTDQGDAPKWTYDPCIELVRALGSLKRQREAMASPDTNAYVAEELDIVGAFFDSFPNEAGTEVANEFDRALLLVLLHLEEDYRFAADSEHATLDYCINAWSILVILEFLFDPSLTSSLSKGQDFRHQVNECLSRIVRLDEAVYTDGLNRPMVKTYLLEYACRQELFTATNLQQMRMLLEAGADPNRRYTYNCDRTNDTPLRIVCNKDYQQLEDKGRLKVAKLLVSHGADPETLLPHRRDWYDVLTRQE